MNPPIETIRLGKQAKDQLIKIKRITGIENWNIICRWALCASLREPTCPPKKRGKSDDGVEMAWRVFAGDMSDVFCAIFAAAECDETKRGDLIHAHLHRGLSYLSSGTKTKSIGEFLERWG